MCSRVPRPAPTPFLHAAVRPHGLERVLPAPAFLSSPHPASPSLSSSLLFLLPLSLVYVFKTQHKSSYSSPGCDPNSKECLYAGRPPFLCVHIAHTRSRTHTQRFWCLHGLLAKGAQPKKRHLGPSAESRKRRRKGKIQKQKGFGDKQLLQPVPLCPLWMGSGGPAERGVARLCLSQQVPPYPSSP